MKLIKANKLQVLEFIKSKQLVWVYELVQEFGYTELSARKRLQRSKNQGLVLNMARGCWELTEEGYRRLRYYGKRLGDFRLSPAIFT